MLLIGGWADCVVTQVVVMDTGTQTSFSRLKQVLLAYRNEKIFFCHGLPHSYCHVSQTLQYCQRSYFKNTLIVRKAAECGMWELNIVVNLFRGLKTTKHLPEW